MRSSVRRRRSYLGWSRGPEWWARRADNPLLGEGFDKTVEVCGEARCTEEVVSMQRNLERALFSNQIRV